MGPTELELIGRVALAAACGAAIGLERELVEKPAGLRTHALVALGAAAFTVAGYAAADPTGIARTDLGRIPAQVASGIGFLGAGIIIFHGDRVRGLTTAAEMWAVAAIGVLSGLGFFATATSMTALILFVVIGGRPLEHVVDRVRRRRQRRERQARTAEIESGEDVEENDDDIDASDATGGVAA